MSGKIISYEFYKYNIVIAKLPTSYLLFTNRVVALINSEK